MRKYRAWNGNKTNMCEDEKVREKKEMDGNRAAAEVAYFFSELAMIYPITPSTGMSEYMDEWAVQGRKNMFGNPVKVKQMQSEAGVAAALHGALLTGCLGVTFTASQGLLLMLPNLYKMVGEQLPAVIYVAARSVASHALSIYGDHSDIYACRQTGTAILCASSVQEVMDLAPVAHIAALRGRLPFLYFFDGFRTSHEMQKIEVWDEETLRQFADEETIRAFREESLTPVHGRQMGSSQEPDVFFQYREIRNRDYEEIPKVVQACMDHVNDKAGTAYRLFEYYGVKDAVHVIVAMGSVCPTIEETVDGLNRAGEKTGLIKVRLYRPFSAQKFVEAIPDTVQILTVLDRTKECGSVGEPLYLDVVGALRVQKRGGVIVRRGRYGLGGKDTTPQQIAAVFRNAEKEQFTIGIRDDLTYLSLQPDENFSAESESCRSYKFWGLGGDGTVGANKSAVKLIGDETDLYAQAYFSYDAKKSRGLTVSHIRLDSRPIRSSYLIGRTDFAACHNPTYMHKYDIVQQIRDGGTFLLNCPYEGEPLERWLPGQVKRYLAAHHIRFFVIDGMRIGKEIGLNGKINTILQAAFFKLSGVMEEKKAMQLLKDAARRAYVEKGSKIVEMNELAIERGMREVREVTVPGYWRVFDDEPLDTKLLRDRREMLDFVLGIQKPIVRQRGNELPVSAFLPYQRGSTPSGSAAHERRNVAREIPVWKPENCIRCNRCSFVCPHAVIRPFVLEQEEAEQAPEGMCHIPMPEMPEHAYEFAIAVSETDCTGCGACAGVCPGKQGEKALVMCPIEQHEERLSHFDYAKALPDKPAVWEKFPADTVKGVQFRRPFLEFHGACAGCGETPYARLVTQLFGEKLYIANATGCSSIWGNSYPSTPYTVNGDGRGPAWANSLFEDAAEFGYGMLLAGKSAESSYWVFGGDGWAYDIGFSGLDHVLASGENINVLVFDTEVYSNTGGQASKATPQGAAAKFATDGKQTKKKDLAAMAMTYGTVYVAQIAMGADFQQTLRALIEAERYDGPSLIIAYAPCISHGIKAGMGSAQHEEKRAVDAGHWHLFRFDPARAARGENPFVSDSGEPCMAYAEFMEGELRYSTPQKKAPERAKQLRTEAAEDARMRYERYREMAERKNPAT